MNRREFIALLAAGSAVGWSALTKEDPELPEALRGLPDVTGTFDGVWVTTDDQGPSRDLAALLMNGREFAMEYFHATPRRRSVDVTGGIGVPHARRADRRRLVGYDLTVRIEPVDKKGEGLELMRDGRIVSLAARTDDAELATAGIITSHNAELRPSGLMADLTFVLTEPLRVV